MKLGTSLPHRARRDDPTGPGGKVPPRARLAFICAHFYLWDGGFGFLGAPSTPQRGFLSGEVSWMQLSWKIETPIRMQRELMK